MRVVSVENKPYVYFQLEIYRKIFLNIFIKDDWYSLSYKAKSLKVKLQERVSMKVN